jgi:hypothetical protein
VGAATALALLGCRGPCHGRSSATTRCSWASPGITASQSDRRHAQPCTNTIAAPGVSVHVADHGGVSCAQSMRRPEPSRPAVNSPSRFPRPLAAGRHARPGIGPRPAYATRRRPARLSVRTDRSVSLGRRWDCARACRGTGPASARALPRSRDAFDGPRRTVPRSLRAAPDLRGGPAGGDCRLGRGERFGRQVVGVPRWRRSHPSRPAASSSAPFLSRSMYHSARHGRPRSSAIAAWSTSCRQSRASRPRRREGQRSRRRCRRSVRSPSRSPGTTRAGSHGARPRPGTARSDGTPAAFRARSRYLCRRSPRPRRLGPDSHKVNVRVAVSAPSAIEPSRTTPSTPVSP